MAEIQTSITANFFCFVIVGLDQLPMAQSRFMCSQVDFVVVVTILITTFPYFDNLKFDFGCSVREGHSVASGLHTGKFGVYLLRCKTHF